MALTVNPSTFVINVPKADLTLIQATPTEIRELNLNNFRFELKDWEDNPEGGIYLYKTHTHNTEVTLGGLTFARVVEILEPYTITFEDGSYAVNLVGANSNVGDRVNVNNVSVRSSNSAGLISTPLIEFSSFENGVWWDSGDISGKAVSGTLFPSGTRLSPTINLSDAKSIAEYRGLNVIYVMGDGTVDSSIDLTRYVFEGQTHVNNQLTVNTSANVTDAVFRDLTVTGVLDGGNELTDCIVSDLDYVNGHIHNCGLEGDITLAGSVDAIMINCVTIDPYNPPVMDMGTSGQSLVMPNYSGLLTLKNLSGASDFIGIGLNAGTVVLEPTITNGTVHISGVGQLHDENGDDILSGTWNTNVTIINQLVNNENISSSVWDELITSHISAGTTGEAIYDILKLTGNKVTKTGDIITIYEANGVDVWRQYNLASDGRVQV